MPMLYLNVVCISSKCLDVVSTVRCTMGHVSNLSVGLWINWLAPFTHLSQLAVSSFSSNRPHSGLFVCPPWPITGTKISIQLESTYIYSTTMQYAPTGSTIRYHLSGVLVWTVPSLRYGRTRATFGRDHPKCNTFITSTASRAVRDF